MRSLATELGVTAATVSLALRNSHRVSAETRDRIVALAKTRGYRPDPLVNQLMHRLRQPREKRYQATIACLTPATRAGPQAQAYVDAILRGVQGRADSLGFKMDRVVPDEFESSDQLRRMLQGRGITGLILTPLPSPGPLPLALPWERFSVVSATSSIESPRFHSVLPNHFDNLVAACRRLQGAGFRRIGLAIQTSIDLRVQHRWSAAMAWHHLLVPQTFAPPLIYDASTASPPADPLLAWVERERLDAVIVHPLAGELAGLSTLRKAQRPKIVTLLPTAEAYALVDQNPEKIGEVAMEVLAGLIATNTTGIPKSPHTTLVDGTWRKLSPVRGTASTS
jgi:DNA-binding LacI/PurR family transcriptional regulator